MFLLIITSLLLTSVLSQALPFFSSHYLILVLDLHQHHYRVSSTKTELESGGQSPVQKHSRSMAETYRQIIVTRSPCRILTTNYQTPAGYVMDIVQGTHHQVPTNSIMDWVLRTNHMPPYVTLATSNSVRGLYFWWVDKVLAKMPLSLEVHQSPLVTFKCSWSDGYDTPSLALGRSYDLPFHFSVAQGHTPFLSPHDLHLYSWSIAEAIARGPLIS